MTTRELRIFKRNAKNKPKEKEVPQEAIDAYNKIVKKQQHEDYSQRLREHREILHERLHYDDFEPKKTSKRDKDKIGQKLDHAAMAGIAQTMDEYI